MNEVSYTIRLTVGPVPQVDAVVLGGSRETSLFVRMLARKPEGKSTDVSGLCSRTQRCRHTKECENGDRSYSTPGSSPNAEGLQTSHHNISPS